MHDRFTAVAFDLDGASLISLKEALPEWEIEVLSGATAASLTHDWNPGEADLLVVGVRANVTETLGLCRYLVLCSVFSRDSWEEGVEISGLHRGRQNQAHRGDAPLLVLLPPGQETLVRAALAAGADKCLVLPIHPKDMATMLASMQQRNLPRRPLLYLDQARGEDQGRYNGGAG